MNPWLSHVAEFRKANPDVKYKQALSEAKKTYKQTPAPAPVSITPPVVEVPLTKPKKSTQRKI
jgi:hypothetical protein